MRRSTLIFASALLVTLCALTVTSCGHRRKAVEPELEAVNDSIPPLGFWTEDFRRDSGVVASGETFSGLLGRLGMASASAYQLVQRCEGAFDVRKLRAGNHYVAYKDSVSGELEHVEYTMDRIRTAVFDCGDSLDVRIVEKPVTVSRSYTDVTIHESLWNDMRAAGSSPLLILKLSDVFAWTVDFFGLQDGDRFRVIYEQTECEGEIFSVDTIYFARFTRDDDDLYAVMLDQGDGGNVYWNEKGESLRRAFLKAPLEFKRISSGFSYHRKHPVTGQVKAHTAVDYAAPTGTPVVALGDGTVLSAGWAGGGGNTIKIRHNSVYVTSYMHLSKYAKGIKAGVRVKQGQVIGYVGMTGTATGPHLDFRVYKNGTAINPLTLESPSAEPIREEFKPALDSVFAAYKAEMDSLSLIR